MDERESKAIEALLRALEDERQQKRLRTDTMATLAEFGLRGPAAYEVLGRLIMGELRVNGWYLGSAAVVMSPWPSPQGSPSRSVGDVQPNEIEAGTESEISIEVGGLKDGDRILFRELATGYQVLASVSHIDLENHRITGTVIIKRSGEYDVYVGRRTPPGEWGKKGGGLTVT